MPKKTRRDKIVAQERKRLKLLAQVSISEITPVREPLPKIAKTTVVESLSQEDISVKNYFFGDLKKSFLLIGCIIALEIVIYFVTINNY